MHDDDDDKIIDPGLDPRLGAPPESLSQEMLTIIQMFRELAAHQQMLFRQLADVLQSHMARQNMLIDRVILNIGVTNCALETMLGPAQQVQFRLAVRKMQEIRQRKVDELKEKLEERQAAQAEEDPTPDEV